MISPLLRFAAVSFSFSFAILPAWLAAQGPAVPSLPLVFEPTAQAGLFMARSGAITWGFRDGRMIASHASGDTVLEVVGARPTAHL